MKQIAITSLIICDKKLLTTVTLLWMYNNPSYMYMYMCIVCQNIRRLDWINRIYNIKSFEYITKWLAIHTHTCTHTHRQVRTRVRARAHTHTHTSLEYQCYTLYMQYTIEMMHKTREFMGRLNVWHPSQQPRNVVSNDVTYSC